jgi:hypothetical protein
MRLTMKDMKNVQEYLRYKLSVPEDADIEIAIRDEDFDQNKIGSCMTLVVTYDKAPGQYDKWLGLKTVKHIMEVYPASEGRNPRITTEESFEVKPD